MGTFLFGIGAGWAASKAMSWLTHPAYTARFGSPHVANAVAQLIKTQGQQWFDSTAATVAIREQLGEAARQAGASDVRFDFLVDLAVLRRSRLEMVMLASDSQADWRKLVHIKAPLRVLLCNSAALADDDLRDFVRMLAAYGDHRAGEEYLILNWRREHHVLHAHLWRAGANGRIAPLNIRCVKLPGFPKEV